MERVGCREQSPAPKAAAGSGRRQQMSNGARASAIWSLVFTSASVDQPPSVQSRAWGRAPRK
ncbi:hypothetical protein ZHAS_00002850 [Anopheles sinensis]|uniref:Uncharacterized protein n=1 Tax=Anopheles sinensis TaxID=74873 RepID=A0A084VD49_ANOSI|nr:hypothetical protein ZHAS_00002850 [Anopheles sinensis]